MKKHGHGKKGISIRNLNFTMAVVTVIISVLLLLATYRANTGYIRMRANTEHYIQWQRYAYDLQTASDYLTEQVRCFVETGKREYLDNYFEEAHVTRRRELALEHIREFLGETDAHKAMQAAMDASVKLMDREYYAMRLTIAGYGYDVDEYPEEIRRVELTEEDAILSRERQEALGRSKVFDEVYHACKDLISKNMQKCLEALANDIDGQQQSIADRLHALLAQQRLLIILAIGITMFTMLLTMLLVISPLLRAVMYIRADEPIPIKGSNEFQFLARTYNLMYEANREQKEQLAYEATHDQLTGIYNRSGYDFFMKNTDWKTSALLLFDVDKFKQVNDSLGHETGDRVLAKVAATIRNCFRSQDYVCRIGGDEFAVIMVHAGAELGELIRSKVARINEALNRPEGDLPPVHVSSGVAFGAVSGDAEEVFRDADAALYEVKNSGGCGCRASA